MRSLVGVAASLRAASLPFAFCGGWGLEIFLASRGASLGRTHSDIDVAVRRDDDARWASFLGTVLTRVSAHEARVTLAGLEVELVANDVAGDDWVYRRDARVRSPLARALITQGDLPFLAPEIVLLFKAKNTRPKDRTDFAAVAPLLEPSARGWLREAIEIAHPGHEWLAELQR